MPPTDPPHFSQRVVSVVPQDAAAMNMVGIYLQNETAQRAHWYGTMYGCLVSILSWQENQNGRGARARGADILIY